MSIKDQIFSAKKRRDEIILPELGVTVFAQELSSSQVIEFTKRQKVDAETAVYYLIVASIVDAEGLAVFSDSDIPAIKELGTSIADNLMSKVLEVSRLNQTTDTKKNNVAT